MASSSSAAEVDDWVELEADDWVDITKPEEAKAAGCDCPEGSPGDCAPCADKKRAAELAGTAPLADASKPRVPLGLAGKLAGAPGYSSKLPEAGPKDPDAQLRGIASGATMRFADEITGAIRAPFTRRDTTLEDLVRGTQGETLADAYRREQLESEANYAAAEERSPGEFLRGELMGAGAVPGFGTESFVSRGILSRVLPMVGPGGVVAKGTRAAVAGGALSVPATIGNAPGGTMPSAGELAGNAALVGIPSGIFGAGSAAIERAFANRAAKLAGKADDAFGVERELEFQGQRPKLEKEAKDEAARQDMGGEIERGKEIYRRQKLDEADTDAYLAELDEIERQDMGADIEHGMEANRRKVLDEKAEAAYAAEKERVVAANKARQFETVAAKEAAREAAAARNAAAVRAAELETRKVTRDRAIYVTGLKGKEKEYGGFRETRKAAESIWDEPLPGEPGTSLARDTADMTPELRRDYAEKIRKAESNAIGASREEIRARSSTRVPSDTVKADIRAQLGKGRGTKDTRAVLRELDKTIDELAADGTIGADDFQSLVDEMVDLAKPNSRPALEGRVGAARVKHAADTARAIFRGQRDRIVKQDMGEEFAGTYAEQLRRFGVYKDFERGAESVGRKGDRPAPKVVKPEKVRPEKVPAPELEAVPKGPNYPTDQNGRRLGPPLPPAKTPRPDKPVRRPEPLLVGKTVPEDVPETQFPGGREAFDSALERLDPDTGLRSVARVIAEASGAGAGFSTGSGLSAYVLGRSGSAAGREIIDRWMPLVRPRAADLARKSSKAAATLERYRPILEAAIKKGPRAIAAAHRELMARPDYAAAVGGQSR